MYSYSALGIHPNECTYAACWYIHWYIHYWYYNEDYLAAPIQDTTNDLITQAFTCVIKMLYGMLIKIFLCTNIRLKLSSEFYFSV